MTKQFGDSDHTFDIGEDPAPTSRPGPTPAMHKQSHYRAPVSAEWLTDHKAVCMLHTYSMYHSTGETDNMYISGRGHVIVYLRIWSIDLDCTRIGG